MSTIVYTKPHCPYCEAARRDFAERGEAFEERDASTDAAWKAELMEYTHGRGMVPTIVRAGGEVQVGFPPGSG